MSMSQKKHVVWPGDKAACGAVILQHTETVPAVLLTITPGTTSDICLHCWHALAPIWVEAATAAVVTEAMRRARDK